MASVRENKREDGSVRSYQVLYRIDGRQSSLPLADRESADQLKELMNRVGVKVALELHGFSTDPVRRPSAGMTVARWVRHYIDHMTGVEQSSIDKYEAYLANDIAPILGAIALVALTEEDISRWVKWMEATPTRRGKPPAPKTIRNKHGFLSGALGAAVAKGHIAANPAAGRRLPRHTAEDGDDDADDDMRMLLREEFDRLLAAVTEYWRPLVEFLVYSGCRWGEAVALRPEHINRDTGVVRIRQAWKYSSKGYHIGPTKTKRSKRRINVPKRVLDQLDYSHEWLFVNRDGGPVRYAGFRQRVWDKAVARAGLTDPQPTPHDLRHTCASWMIAAGVPLTVVSRHLGHENIQITADTYTDVDRTSFEAAADAIDQPQFG